ncbi:MAG: hypothetical protein U1B94_01765 [candidate division NC10 bacterium]|nr:hypothetical protein [candidate division NC10 bacterium]
MKIPQPTCIFIAPLAFQKLKIYIERCPVEIGGLGEVELRGDRFIVTDLFLIAQRGTPSETELDAQEIASFLAERLAQGRDPALIRVWWHSHADADVHWSLTDQKTIKGFLGDYLISIVGNKRGEFLCRLDTPAPASQTIEDLPLIPLGEPAVADGPELGRLRRAILGEIREKVRILLPVDLGELYEWTMATASEYYVEGDVPPVNDDQD